MEPHDNALTFIATESELIAPARKAPPAGRRRLGARAPDQFADIPFLSERARSKRARGAMIVNDPETLAEVEALFAAYERALVNNDVEALDGFFLDARRDPLRRRRESLRLSRRSAPFAPRARRPGSRAQLERTQITTYGRDLAIAATLFRRDNAPGKIGRQMQTWVRFPRAGASSPRM
jgi:hypothetical protein